VLLFDPWPARLPLSLLFRIDSLLFARLPGCVGDGMQSCNGTQNGSRDPPVRCLQTT
jgi:hypothetical protein